MQKLLVIDTNIVLDMLVFDDEEGAKLRAQLEAGSLRWIRTRAMRNECERVLEYPQIAKRRAFYGKSNASVLQAYDALSFEREPAHKAPCTCKDVDDQIYIDLAYAHKAPLLSKDRHILALRRRLAKLGVEVGVKLSSS